METNGMKKSILLKLSAITFLMAGVVFCGCSNSNDEPIEPIEPVGPKTYTLTIEASKGGSAETRVLTPGTNSLVSTWGKDDQVFVKHGSTWCDGSLKPQSEEQTTTLRGMITFNGEVKVNDDLTFQYPRESIDYTEQDGTLESIAAKYDYSVATAKVGEVGANAITVTGFSGFANQQAIVKFTLKDKAGANISATSLTISATGLKTSNSTTGDIIVTPTSAKNELYVALSGINNKTVTLIAKTATDTYIYEKSGVTFSDDKYYEITVKMVNIRSIPLTFEAVSGGEINLVFHNHSGGIVDYKVDNGSWVIPTSYTSTLYLTGTKFSFRGNNASYYPYSENPSFFQCSADCYVYGNIMSLVNGKDALGEDAFAHATELTGNDAFRELFKFKGSEGYLGKIKSNQNKPLLLPATTLAPNCYQSMFEGCTELERAPVLPASSLWESCYESMFSGCSKLNYIKCLATDISADKCTKNWVYGVAEEGTFVKAANADWSNKDTYDGIPSGWTVTSE